MTIDVGPNRIIEDYSQVADNKIALMSRTRFDIYNMDNGSLLMTMPKLRTWIHRLFYVENKYVIIYDTSLAKSKTTHKFFVIDLKDMNCYGTNIENEIMSTAYLQGSGYLILGGRKISVWSVNSWPFKQIKKDETAKLSQVRLLLALSDNTFASAQEQKICFWDCEMNILNKIEIEHKITDLKSFDNDKFFVFTKVVNSAISKVFICNSKSGETLKQINMDENIHNVFQTPDKSFLVLTGKKNILFYHLNASYVYLEHEMIKELRSEQQKLKILKDSKFGRLINSDHAIELFNYKL